MKALCPLLLCLVAVAHARTSFRSERVPEEILEKHEDYNLVRYQQTKWVCTKMQADIAQQTRRGLFAFFMYKRESPDNIMFQRLFGYISGENSESVNIDMTSPVTTLRKPIPDQPTMEELEMCFWTGSPWQDKPLPTPTNADVYLQDRPLTEVFVRRFGGWAMSRKTWMEHKQELEKSLAGRSDVEQDPKAGFYTVGYDSPFQIFNRRNEVWLIRKPVDETKSKKEENLASPDFTVISENEKYEVREYPATKWACTKMSNVNPTSDPMNGWQEEFGNNPLEAMQSGKWQDQPSSRMFNKLFAYIAGFNANKEQIPMTSPVSHLHDPSQDQMETQEMCFWLDSEHQASPPEPMGKIVYIQERPLMRVYVRKFGGFALSYNDFNEHYLALKADLAGESFDHVEGRFFQISYDAPFVMHNRHNEVWIQQKP